MPEGYQVVGRASKHYSGELAALLAWEGQLLLPFVDLVETTDKAIDELEDAMGWATIEAILRMNAEAVAGPRQKGKATGRDVNWRGTQSCLALGDRELRAVKTRLDKRQKPAGEVAEAEIPDYEALGKCHRAFQNQNEDAASALA